MEISVEKLLHKMEEKVKEAKGASSDAVIRERIHAIKTMCELILDEPSTTKTAVTTTASVQVAKPVYTGQVSTLPNQQERLVIDEESNGESIFDF